LQWVQLKPWRHGKGKCYVQRANTLITDGIFTRRSEYEDSKYTLFIMARGVTGDIDYGDLKDRIEKELWWSNSPPANREVICTTYMDHVLHSIARCLLPGPDFQEDIMFSAAMWLEGIFEVRRQCARHGLDDPWEYYEHWYWCYFSLEILLKRSDALA